MAGEFNAYAAALERAQSQLSAADAALGAAIITIDKLKADRSDLVELVRRLLVWTGTDCSRDFKMADADSEAANALLRRLGVAHG